MYHSGGGIGFVSRKGGAAVQWYDDSLGYHTRAYIAYFRGNGSRRVLVSVMKYISSSSSSLAVLVV